MRRGTSGTRALVRLALRRDRITLPIWIAVLGVIPASVYGSYSTFYPTAAERSALTSTIGRNPSVAVLYGPAFDLSTAGGFTAWRFGGFLALLTGLMAIFTMTRHTRAEEDSGRAELLASGAIGRYAFLTAAIVVSMGASLLIGALEAMSLGAAGAPWAGSVALGAATASAGLVFTGVAAVACQLASWSRSANGLAASVLGLVFLLRAVGDTSSNARWVSWLSPIGWAQQLRPFAHERWWVLVLPLLTTVATVSAAYAIVARRDLGVGVLPPRPGPSRATPSISSPFALAWRLQRGALTGWLVGIVLSGAVFGSIASGIGDLLGDSTASHEMFERLGGTSGLVDAFLASIAGISGMVVALYGVQAMLRLRTEETSERLEPLLATRVGRLQWAAGHLVFVFGGTALILLAGGVATGVTHGLRVHSVAGSVGDMAEATLAQVPATWLILAIGVALFGIVPRFSHLAWGVAGLALAISLLGPVLDVPQAVLDVSPFGHIPKLPGGQLSAVPFIVLTAMAVTAVAAGLVAFQRRDIG